ncbi:hypothetical protein R3P38DRAFT_3303589 [Favolaschia claudopus]|uniref:HMG domain-containing protein n=1 Tax=Favolaschia claudopus TaxID=2862362 RepID=A0AAW0E6H5_9AGAR
MSTDADDIPYISLDTPPPSPTAQIQLQDSTPVLNSSLSIVTPTRKRRDNENARRRQRRKTGRVDELPVHEEIPAWDSAAAELTTGSEPVWNSPERPVQSVDNEAAAEIGRDQGYPEYCESIQEEAGAFYQLRTDLFVVNGWDTQKKVSKAGRNSWYHLQRSTIGDLLVTACQCPLSRPDNPCVHQQFLTDYGEEMFPFDATMVNSNEDNTAVLFSRAELQEGVFLNHFSAPSSNSRSLAGRVIVAHTGEDIGSGDWLSILRCQILIPRAVPRQRRAPVEQKAVSYLPISPPSWAVLPSDPQLYERAPALEVAPETLCLDATSSCSCTYPRPLYNPARPIVRMRCTVYGLFRAWEAEIELQSCSNARCRHRFVGPDARERGIFNYNNRQLFSHDLLDEYSAAYTSSETPFSAWVIVLSRRYALHTGGVKHPFVTANLFRSVWFAYVQLQYLEGSMTCPRCGPSPQNTIWDGVTLAFNRKHLLPTLEPPTTSQPDSIERTTTRYLPAQQLIVNRSVRRLVRLVITGTPLTSQAIRSAISAQAVPSSDEDDEENEDDDDDTDDDPAAARRGTRVQRAAAKRQRELADRLDAIPRALEGLSRACPALGALFDAKFGEESVMQNRPAADVYRRFFVQICAEESVLQMANRPALNLLAAFIAAPNARSASSLVEIPALHEVLSHESARGEQPFSNTILDVCRFLLERGRAVLNSLIKGPEPPRVDESAVEKPWTETGCCYGLPKIRERPYYPKLKHDVNIDAGGKRGAKCSKFYSQYGERRLTGGIMCVWCTHSICYGFHCIPKGEGRNDVFSALLTRWETAPKRVIYDFACALGPYCMTREPEFFANTQFLIDDFHSVGHTKCSPAAFLKTHCNVDARLSYINSSAGECGNSGLGRIRKSVSYMSQGRAILYSRVFLCIWNRLRIRNMN